MRRLKYGAITQVRYCAVPRDAVGAKWRRALDPQLVCVEVRYICKAGLGRWGESERLGRSGRCRVDQDRADASISWIRGISWIRNPRDSGGANQLRVPIICPSYGQ